MSDETSPANKTNRRDEPLRLDALLREFYAREKQRGLPRRSGSGAGAAAVPGSMKRAAEREDAPGVVAPHPAGRPARVVASPTRLVRESAPGTAAKRGSAVAVVTAACTLMLLATVMLQHSGQHAERTLTVARPAAEARAGSGSAASAAVAGRPEAAVLAHEADGSRREAVERGGRPRVDARTDGVPVLHGDGESPHRPGLEIHVPDEAIEIFPIDERARRPVVAPKP